MKLSPKQSAKRRWKESRDLRALLQRSIRAEWRKLERIKTPFGTIVFKSHPLAQQMKKCPECGKWLPADEVHERVDPYGSELFGDETLNEMCNGCELTSARET